MRSRTVTPFVGVWIETVIRKTRPDRYFVTPFVGVWIETGNLSIIALRNAVTPFVGVWIETKNDRKHRCIYQSHPSWVCGLKLSPGCTIAQGEGSHPSWVCGLKREIS